MFSASCRALSNRSEVMTEMKGAAEGTAVDAQVRGPGGMIDLSEGFVVGEGFRLGAKAFLLGPALQWG